ncbi:hypothetical protein ACLKA6_005556 [Drosophila palustris]
MSAENSDEKTLSQCQAAVTTDDEAEKQTPKNEECNQPEVEPSTEDIPKKVEISARVEENKETDIDTVEDVSSDEDTLTQIPSYYSGAAFGQIQEQKINFPLAKNAEIIDKPKMYNTLNFDIEEVLSQQKIERLVLLLVSLMERKHKRKIVLLLRVRQLRAYVTNSVFYIMCFNIVFMLFLIFYIVDFPLSNPKPEPYLKGLMRKLF